MLGLEDWTARIDPLAVFRHLCAISSTVAAGPVWSPVVGSERERQRCCITFWSSLGSLLVSLATLSSSEVSHKCQHGQRDRN